MPKDSVAKRRSGLITSCEKYGGIAASSPLDRGGGELRRVCAAGGGLGAEQVGQRERRAQPRAARSRAPRCSRTRRAPGAGRRSSIRSSPGWRGRVPDTSTATSPPTPVSRSSVSSACSELRSWGTSFVMSVSTLVCVSSPQPSAASASPAHSTRSGRRSAGPSANRDDGARQRVVAQQLAGPAPGRGQPPRAPAGARARAGGAAARRAAAARAPRRRRSARTAARSRRPRRAARRSRAPSAPARAAARASPRRSPRRRWRSSGRRRARRARSPQSRSGPGGGPARLAAERLADAGLELDRVVDGEADQHRQHGDRGDGQRGAGGRQRAEGQRGGEQRERQRQQARAARRRPARACRPSRAAPRSAAARSRSRSISRGRRRSPARPSRRSAPAVCSCHCGIAHGGADRRDRAVALLLGEPGRRRTEISALSRLGNR